MDRTTSQPIPTGVCLSTVNPCVNVPVNFNRLDTTPARGASVTFQLSSELELCVDEDNSIYQGTWLSGFFHQQDFPGL